MSKTTEVSLFKYEQLDEHTADFLRRKESNMREIVGKAYTELGRELYEAQRELSKNGYGCFEAWCKHVGVIPRQARRLIDRYELIRTNCPQRELLEDMPVSLTYEIAKPSAESTPEKTQAKMEVLAGEVSTLKAYKERIKELETEYERLVCQPPKIETHIEYVEIDNIPNDYEQIKQQLDVYNEKFGSIENYDEHITASNRQDMLVAVSSFNKGIRDFAKRYAYLTKYHGVINNLDEESKQQYNEAVSALKELADTFKYSKRGLVVVNN